MGKGLNISNNEVSARDDALFFQALTGKNGIFEYGNKMDHEVISANQINIKDGMLQVQGRNYVIYPNDIEELTIENGTQNTQRYDLVVCEFKKVGSAESMELKILTGEASLNPVDPVLTQDDTLTSGKTYQYPLYRIKLNGINIEGIDDLRTYTPSLKKTLQFVSKGEGTITVEFDVD